MEQLLTSTHTNFRDCRVHFSVCVIPPTTFLEAAVCVTFACFQLIENIFIGFEHRFLAEIFRGRYLFNCGWHVHHVSGCFLIPYLICLVVAGVPVLVLEIALGQYTSQGAITAWKICPLFQGTAQ